MLKYLLDFKEPTVYDDGNGDYLEWESGSQVFGAENDEEAVKAAEAILKEHGVTWGERYAARLNFLARIITEGG